MDLGEGLERTIDYFRHATKPGATLRRATDRIVSIPALPWVVDRLGRLS